MRGFKRVAIAKGNTTDVEIALSPEDFEWFDTETNTMRQLEGEYEILYGGTSDVNKLKKTSITIE